MLFIIGISCPGFCMTDFRKMLQDIKPHFRLWEIISEGEHEITKIKDDIRNAMDSHDMKFTLHAPFADLNLASLNPRIRKFSLDQIEESIRISSELGIKVVTIHPGHKSPLGAYFSDLLESKNKESIRELDKMGQEYGVVLALENMPKMWVSLCHDASQLKGLIEGTELKICFDFGHANISNSVEEILGLKRDFANIHIHDNDGQKDLHQILGKGTMDIPAILGELGDYKGHYIIESSNLSEGIKSMKILNKML